MELRFTEHDVVKAVWCGRGKDAQGCDSPRIAIVVRTAVTAKSLGKRNSLIWSNQMCVSAATVSLREARRLEWASSDFDEEDELPSSRTSLGLLMADLEDELDMEAPSFSPASHASVSPHRSHAHFVAAEVQYHLSYMQQVVSF